MANTIMYMCQSRDLSVGFITCYTTCLDHKLHIPKPHCSAGRFTFSLGSDELSPYFRHVLFCAC